MDFVNSRGRPAHSQPGDARYRVQQIDRKTDGLAGAVGVRKRIRVVGRADRENFRMRRRWIERSFVLRDDEGGKQPS